MNSVGCLVTDNPEFQAPATLPPFLSNLSPPTSRILVIPRKPGTTAPEKDYVQNTEISFDIRSEDLQRPLWGSVYLDFPKPSKIAICLFSPSTGTINKARRENCTLAIPSSVESGCHSITALVSHSASIITGRIEGDLDTATWWAQIGRDEGSYDPCEPDPLPGDGGVDAGSEGGLR
jgi:hypothetical protein